MNSNPYRPPQAHVRDMPEADVDERLMSRLASGQKLAIRAIGLYFVAAFARGFLIAGTSSPVVLAGMGIAMLLVGIVALVMSLAGMWRMAEGLKVNPVVSVLILLLMFVPLLNILVLLVINARATRALRRAGYRVGFLGVSDQRA
jgi:hypothetical protein